MTGKTHRHHMCASRVACKLLLDMAGLYVQYSNLSRNNKCTPLTTYAIISRKN